MRFTAFATSSLMSASGGTPAGNCSTTFRITTPAGVFTGGDTPPIAIPNATSCTPSVRSRPLNPLARLMIDSRDSTPSRLASAAKSLAAWSAGRISPAFAIADFSIASVISFTRIWGATSFIGFRPPSRMSSTLIA